LQAGCRQYGYRYSQFIHVLSQSNIILNRKVLAEMAANEPFAFKSIVDVVNHQISPSQQPPEQKQQQTL
jgi:large subunit ribosomal protein L20